MFYCPHCKKKLECLVATVEASDTLSLLPDGTIERPDYTEWDRIEPFRCSECEEVIDEEFYLDPKNHT
jgi:hypothetical protein